MGCELVSAQTRDLCGNHRFNDIFVRFPTAAECEMCMWLLPTMGKWYKEMSDKQLCSLLTFGKSYVDTATILFSMHIIHFKWYWFCNLYTLWIKCIVLSSHCLLLGLTYLVDRSYEIRITAMYWHTKLLIIIYFVCYCLPASTHVFQRYIKTI